MMFGSHVESRISDPKNAAVKNMGVDKYLRQILREIPKKGQGKTFRQLALERQQKLLESQVNGET